MGFCAGSAGKSEAAAQYFQKVNVLSGEKTKPPYCLFI